MRNIVEVLESKNARLQLLQREMQEVEGQVEVLQSALRLLEQEEGGRVGTNDQTMSSPKKPPEPAAVAGDAAQNGAWAQAPKRFP